MVIYVLLDENQNIEGWGSTPPAPDSIKLTVEDGHPFFDSDPRLYTLKDGKLSKSENFEDIILVEMKEEKKEELSFSCKKKIEEGFQAEVSGKVYQFSYSLENQQNFSDTMRLFDNNMIDTITWNAYLGKEKVRIALNKKEFTRVYLAGVKHKTDCITRLNDTLYPLVDAAKNKETVARIYWDEGLSAEELSLKEGSSVEEQINNLTKKDSSLEQADMMTMMAVMQLSGRINS